MLVADPHGPEEPGEFAARRDTVQAPNLLGGHSLGGAAVIMAASRIEEVVAVATIDRADHLLSNPRDADYVATVTAIWVDRYCPSRPAAAWMRRATATRPT